MPSFYPSSGGWRGACKSRQDKSMSLSFNHMKESSVIQIKQSPGDEFTRAETITVARMLARWIYETLTNHEETMVHKVDEPSQ